MLNPSSFSPPPFHSYSPLIMPIEEEPEPEPPTSAHILDWLEDSISFPFLNEPYTAAAAADDDGINSYNQWWDQQDDEDNLINASSINSSPTALPNPSPPQPESSKKRKPPNNATAKKQSSGKTNGTNSGGGGNKDARWAEQLLNPCASAIGAGNLSRVRHLLYVLHELASLSGDANYRLAAHGLRALTNHLSSSGSVSVPGVSIDRPPTFATTEPRLFQNSLIKFHELSPWFSFPNSLANASILQTLTTLDPSQQHSSSSRRQRNLHIVDIGVSHGIQWPTLLESLANRPGGPPPLVRLTVVAVAGTPASFSSGPPGDDYPSRLLRFAKRNNLNLQIDRVESHPLQTLTAEVLGVASRGEGEEEETLIICAQFRLHQLPHEDPDDRTEFLRRMRDLEPDLVVLTENDGDCSCSCCCGDFALGFPRRVEFAWKLLDSTSAAFKGRECQERRVIEGEAATALSSAAEMNEGKAGWCERMRGLGFIGEGFGEEAVEGGRTLLRKYDGNWEMRAEEKGRQGCICLCWKGKPVSFCSLWKLPTQ